MLTTRVILVKFQSIDPEEDPLVNWLDEIGFWDFEVEQRVLRAKLHLPLDIETRFRESFNLPMQEPTRTLFGRLLNSENGIELRSLGLTKGAWKNLETCIGKLFRLGLVRVQDEVLVKALPIAFDPRVQYILGTRRLPIQ